MPVCEHAGQYVPLLRFLYFAHHSICALYVFRFLLGSFSFADLPVLGFDIAPSEMVRLCVLQKRLLFDFFIGIRVEFCVI